jgi:ABC-2 type transport system ATP-binding protein
MVDAIQVSGLVKDYGATRALDGLELRVRQGEIHGLLGPNGSGKTTTLRILLGLVRADAGNATLLGADPWADAAALHRRLAYVPGDVTLWPDLTGGEVIDLLCRLRGSIDEGRRDDLIKSFDLDPRKKGRTYSKGNRQKVALVAALASDVELLLLDEPTSGLDPLIAATFHECLVEEKQKGRTILLSSHVLGEVETTCDRVSIIRAGRTVEQGTLGDLRHLTRTRITAEVSKPADSLENLAGVHGFETDGNRISMDVDAKALDAVVRRLGTLGVKSLISHPPTLEELFLRLYGRKPEAHDAASGKDAA